MDRQGWALGLVTAGSTPPPGHWCGMRRRDKAMDRACSAQPRPAPPFLRCWEDLRLRGLAKKWSWGGAVERSAVLKPPPLFQPRSSEQPRHPLALRRHPVFPQVLVPSPSQPSGCLCRKAGSSPARPYKNAAPPQPAARPQR